jgi:hypothetical protein
MKTLTITDAKKNLGRWLNAAARGEDSGIISGADIIALRKVEVEIHGLRATRIRGHEGTDRCIGKCYREAPSPAQTVGKTCDRPAEQLRKMLE